MRNPLIGKLWANISYSLLVNQHEKESNLLQICRMSCVPTFLRYLDNHQAIYINLILQAYLLLDTTKVLQLVHNVILMNISLSSTRIIHNQK